MLIAKGVVCQQDVSKCAQKSDKISTLQSALSRVSIRNSFVFFPYHSNHIILSYHKQRGSFSCFITIVSRQWNQWESFTCSHSSSVCRIDASVMFLIRVHCPPLSAQYALVHSEDSSTSEVSKWRSMGASIEHFKISSFCNQYGEEMENMELLHWLDARCRNRDTTNVGSTAHYEGTSDERPIRSRSK